MQIIKEVCVDSLEDAIKAEKNGANRIELCGRLDLDGLTPSRDLISNAFSILKIPIRVMIRPKHPSFEYSEEEINTMIDDIKFCKSLGVDGVVFGCLDENSNFQMDQINRLSIIAKPLNVIIHKAIDYTSSILDSLSLISNEEDSPRKRAGISAKETLFSLMVKVSFSKNISRICSVVYSNARKIIVAGNLRRRSIRT